MFFTARLTHFPLEVLGMIDQPQLETLIAAAVSARRAAYAPYSNFAVGAALLSSDGQVFAGCNVENASFGLTLCAERTAAAAAIATGCREFHAVVVLAHPVSSPCGACRQFLYEFGKRMQVIAVDAESGQVWQQWQLSELLPHGFTLD